MNPDYMEQLARDEALVEPYDVPYSKRVKCKDGLERWVVHHPGGAVLLWSTDGKQIFEPDIFHTPTYALDVGECWCRECHTQMDEGDGVWTCPECGNEYAMEDGVDESTPYRGAPSLEASYDYLNIPRDKEWCTG